MKNLFTVGKYTFIEVYRSKLMVSLLFLALGLVLLSYIASEFAYGAPGKVSLDVGLGLMSITNLIIAIFIGATLLSKEIEQRTLYMIISKPISRSSFLVGKILGLSTVLLINTILLGSLSILLYSLHDGQLNTLFIWSTYFSFLEAFTILLFSVLFSLITNTTLSVIYSIGIFIVGHALNETSKILFSKISPVISSVLDISFLAIPNLYRLNLKDFLIYNQSISFTYLMQTQLYCLLYIMAILTLILFIFKNKNLD